MKRSELPLIVALCPVCAHTLAAPFFAGGLHPLATVGWPRSASEAQAMPRHPHDFVQCPSCSHVWNHSFRYDAISYQNNPSRMFNNGTIWQGHLALTRDLVLKYLPPSPTVIEIGCGEGHFIRGLAEACDRHGRFVGFDPNSSPESGLGVEFHSRLFEPLTDMATFAPDVIVIRHVLEHLTMPAELLDQMAWAATHLDKPCWLFAETPCIDRASATGRLADFFYEHAAHFTTLSFRTLLQRTGDVVDVAHGYDGEVVYGLVRLSTPDAMQRRAADAFAFSQRAIANRSAIRNQIDELAKSGARVAIWGGTGKAAAFIQQFGADAKRFPLVVDSDPDKVGTYVSGTGQRISARDVFKTQHIDVVIIPTQWRAKDIAAEMARENILVDRILIEHQGGLVDFRTGDHPYR